MKDIGLRKLTFNIGATFFRQIIAALLNLMTVVFIARVYGPEGNGAFAIALLLPSLLVSFLNLGVASANVYYLGSQQLTVRQCISANLRIFAVLSLLGLVVGSFMIYRKNEALFPGIDPFILWLALAVFPIALLNSYLLSVFQGLQRFGPYNLLGIIQPAVLLFLVGGLIVSGNRFISLLMAAQVVSQVVVLIFTAFWLGPLVEKRVTDDLPGSVIRKTIRYGWKAHLSNILAFVNYKADVFLANFFLGPGAVGIYVIAVALAEKLWLISQAVSTVLLPKLTELSSNEDRRIKLTPFITRWVLLATLTGAIGVAILADWLIRTFFGADYVKALIPLWVLLPGIVMTSASRILANDIAARGRPELNMYTSIFVVIINIIGNLLLIPPYGLFGAALATTLAYTVNLMLRLMIYGRFSGNRWFDSIIIKPADILYIRNGIRGL
ncbi:flippase [Methylotuvimicrobium buryatense]|uniref:Flippase n=1 Tax=Methylotuvimicrobium buryatense TaxID=95641 RepID=A0A4P9UKJ2_METBY|nr:flippase [Methylotuvimicrobium buryatense]QCW81577.1 flippase [Methylotuvimicrobium buryatense]